jgi:hypothetical protein
LRYSEIKTLNVSYLTLPPDLAAEQEKGADV